MVQTEKKKKKKKKIRAEKEESRMDPDDRVWKTNSGSNKEEQRLLNQLQ